MRFVLADRHHPLRGRLENTVRAVFLSEYGAHVPRFPDRLIARLDDAGNPQAVAGLHFSRAGLFSEAYLDGPVESVLTVALRRPVARDRVVEFSNLAAPFRGAAIPLIWEAIRVCRDAGADAAIFTVTARLRTLLQRNRLATVDLGPARPERLRAAAVWGSYYLHEPRVLAATAESLPPAYYGAAPVIGDRCCA